MTQRRRASASHGLIRRALLLILTAGPLILAIAALSYGTGTNATAQTRAPAQPHAKARTDARTRTDAPAQTAATPSVVFHEDFENNVGTTPVALPNYVGPTGETYTADPAWLANCNGVIINWGMTTNPSNCNTPPPGGSTSPTGMQSLRTLANAMGQYRGLPAGNSNDVVAAFTDNGAPSAVDPGAGKVQFQTVDRKSTRLNSSHSGSSRMPSSA